MTWRRIQVREQFAPSMPKKWPPSSRKQLDSWRESVGAQMMAPNPGYSRYRRAFGRILAWDVFDNKSRHRYWGCLRNRGATVRARVRQGAPAGARIADRVHEGDVGAGAASSLRRRAATGRRQELLQESSCVAFKFSAHPLRARTTRRRGPVSTAHGGDFPGEGGLAVGSDDRMQQPPRGLPRRGSRSAFFLSARARGMRQHTHHKICWQGSVSLP